MNFVNQKSNGNSVAITSECVWINDAVYPIPEHVKRKKGNNTCIVNGTCYINGYKVTEKGEYKRSISALFHLLF